MRKLLLLSLVVILLLFFSACGEAEKRIETNQTNQTSEPTPCIQQKTEQIVICSVSKDLELFAEKYTNATGIKTQVKLISPDEFSAEAIDLNDADIIAADEHMLPLLFEECLLEDLADYGVGEKIDDVIGLVIKCGTDKQGALRALSYQMPIGVMLYRADLAKDIFGYGEPDKIGELFRSHLTIVNTAQRIFEKGLCIFDDTVDIEKYSGEGDEWVLDGKLNISKARTECLNACVELFQEGYTSGQAKVFAKSVPAWAIFDELKDCKNKGVCAGPGGYVQGTWVGISSASKNKQQAYKFLEFVTLEQNTARWWTDTTGQPSCCKSVLDSMREYAPPGFSGQKIYEFLLEEAKRDIYSMPAIYDKFIGAKFAEAVSNVKLALLTKQEAIESFCGAVAQEYPHITQ